MTRVFAASLLTCTLTALPLPARSDAPPTTFSIDATTMKVTPGNTYGPWDWLTMSYRTTTGDDKPGITIVTRSDRDAAAPASGTSYVIDDYHQFSQRAYGYASVQISSGSIFPTRGAYVEGDAAIADGVAFGGGIGWLANPDRTSQEYLSLGPTLYFPHGNATLRFLPLWTHGGIGSSSWLASATIGDESHTSATITLQDGTEPNDAGNSVILAPGSAQRSFAAELAFRHFLTPHFGYDAGLLYALVSDRNSGTLLYHASGISLGFVWAP